MLRPAFSSGRKLRLVLALAVAVLGGAWWGQRSPPEPVHDGKRLSTMLFSVTLNRYYLRSVDDGSGVRVVKPMTGPEQLRAFGPGVVTWLAYTVEHGKRPFINTKQKPLPFDKAPMWLRRWLPDRWGGIRNYSGVDERLLAIEALRLLGPDAAGAIPTLARSLNGGPEDLRRMTAETLHTVGPASWLAVQQVLAHGPQPARLTLVQTISTRVEWNQIAAPEAEITRVAEFLAKACADSDADVRTAAASAITSYHEARRDTSFFDLTIPSLIRLLSDADKNARASATKALGFFGVKSAGAASRLIQLLDDEDPQVRYYAALTMPNVDVAEKRSAPRLLMMLHDSDNSCRVAAAGVLQAFDLYPSE